MADREAAPRRTECSAGIVTPRFMICVQQVAVCKVFVDMPPRIAPVIEDLASEDVATDAGVVVVARTHQMVVARHHRIHVLHLEGSMVEARLANAHTQERVMIGKLIPAVATHESGDDVVGFAEIDLIRGQETEA